MSELNNLVGLSQVKEMVGRQIRLLMLEQAKRSRGLSNTNRDLSLHMVFTGNPGTGKTTVARLMGRIFKALGLLQKGHLVEVSRSELVAGYVGQTALKTKEKIKSALDGILFIDEAYSLARGGIADFGQEAIDTLVKAMEDYRDRLIVILAGYPQEMAHLMSTNPGLSSRFNLRIHFPDYTPDELTRILIQMISQEGYEIGDGVQPELENYFRHAMINSHGQNGNGRTARNLFLEMEGHLAERYYEAGNLSPASQSGNYQTAFRFETEDIPTSEHQAWISKENTGIIQKVV
jgi:stage V sporulation protein K